MVSASSPHASWVERSQRSVAAVLLLAALLVAGGVYEATRLPSAIFPDVTFPLVRVIADAGEEPAAAMVPTVTRPLEEALLRVPGIVLVRSTTSRGSAELDAQFAWGTDMQVALERVQAELARVRPALPGKVTLEAQRMNTATAPILGYALTSATLSQADLRAFAVYTLEPHLVRIPGVSQVQVQGGLDREFQVRLDANALMGRGLAPADVVTAVEKDDRVESAGLTQGNHELYLTLVDGRVRTTADLADIAVPVPGGGVPARLGDLGTVTVADAVSYIRTTAAERPAVLVNLIRQPAASTLAIAGAVDRLFRDQPGLLPHGVRWETFYDQAAYVRTSVGALRDAIVLGVALAALVLLLFLRRFGIALVAVAAIPVTAAIVALGLAATGQTINLMTLAGLAAALGLIADDAIVVTESIQRRAEAGDPAPAHRGLAEIVPALVASSLSSIVIFLPFALLSGVAGAFFRPLALTMALALAVSFLLALLAVPPAVGRLDAWRARRRARRTRRAGRVAHLRAAARARLDRLRAAARRRGLSFTTTAGFFVRHGWLSALALALLLAGGYLLYRGIGTDFLPRMDEGAIILDYWSPPGTSLDDTDAMLRQVERVIVSLPDVAAYSRRLGTQLGFFITEPNRGDYVIKLRPRGERRPIGEVIDDLRARIARVEPALHIDFGQLLEDEIGDLTGGEPQPVDVKIYGPDPALLADRAGKAAALIRTVPGVEDVFDGVVIAGPSIEVRAHPGALARYDMTTSDLEGALQPAVAGTVASQVRVGDRLYDVRVFARSDLRFQHLPVRTPSGALLPLATLASVSTGAPEAEIDRENLATYVGVTARLSGRDLGGAIAQIRDLLARRLNLAPGMSLAFGGQYAQQQASFRGLLAVLLGGLVLVAVVLLFTFGDWRAPVVTALASLASLAGVFTLLVLTGMTLNLSSYVGAIMMVGIVGENAVFVIHEARLELRAGRPPDEAWTRAARRRLRPVAMTILASALALAPLALDLGAGAQLQQPLAIGVIGGFVLSGPIVLLFVPGLYRLLDPRGRLAGAAR